MEINSRKILVLKFPQLSLFLLLLFSQSSLTLSQYKIIDPKITKIKNKFNFETDAKSAVFTIGQITVEEGAPKQKIDLTFHMLMINQEDKTKYMDAKCVVRRRKIDVECEVSGLYAVFTGDYNIVYGEYKFVENDLTVSINERESLNEEIVLDLKAKLNEAGKLNKKLTKENEKLNHKLTVLNFEKKHIDPIYEKINDLKSEINKKKNKRKEEK